MKIATWNVNSIRSRLEHVQTWLKSSEVDLLCVQETKVVDQDFPRSVFTELGYHSYISGQKSYNGVALISQAPLEAVNIGFAEVVGSAAESFEAQKRVISGVLNGIRVVNLYVPNGSEVGSEKYEYKLSWFAVLRDYLKILQTNHPEILVCGDFNIAPEDRDIYDPKGKETHIMSSPAEREALQRSVLDLGFADACRQFHEDGQFTWWDYRTAGFQRNRGWRIDHHYLSEKLRDRARTCEVDTVPRRWEKPSDHAPVIVELL
jgi:exodeoxyribonuclease-3